MEVVEKAAELLMLIKKKRPLIHHITNYVTMNDCANIILAVGGSPIMANDPAEAEEVTAISGALVLNLGTPNQNSFNAMLLAGKKANEMGIPIIVDPVGAGTTQLRRDMCGRLLNEVKPAVIKGNLSEIMYLASIDGYSHGIDSYAAIENECETVRALANKLKCIVAATGREDIVSDGRDTIVILNGHELLSRITGSGCMTAALVAAFCSVTQDYLAATVGGIITINISGEAAALGLLAGEGIGTFKTRFFDSVFSVSKEILLRECEVHHG